MFGWLKPKPQVVQVEKDDAISIQMTREAIVIESTDIEVAVALIQFWQEENGAKPAEKPAPKIGFNNDHMSDLMSDVDHAGSDEPEEMDEVDDED